MNLDLTSEQQMLRDSLRGMCTAEMSLEVVRRTELDARAATNFSAELRELGIPGLRIAVEHGGTGLGLTELVVAYFELGRVLAPGPHIESFVMVPALLAKLSAPEAASLLRGIADGTEVVMPAWQERDGRGDLHSIQTRLLFDDGRPMLTGEKLFIPNVRSASRQLVLARNSTGGYSICIISANAAGVEESLQPNLAGQPLSKMVYRNTPVDAVLGPSADVELAWTRMFYEGLIASAAMAAGGAERILEITKQYACERQQFGKPIGAFQAIAHYLADAAVEAAAAPLLAYRAASAADEGSAYEYFAVVAKLQACSAFRKISALSVQVHGGLGFTLAGDPQLFLRRAKQQQLLHGDPTWLEELAGEQLFDRKRSVFE